MTTPSPDSVKKAREIHNAHRLMLGATKDELGALSDDPLIELIAEALDTAKMEEREACAKAVEVINNLGCPTFADVEYAKRAKKLIAKAIRQRGGIDKRSEKN